MEAILKFNLSEREDAESYLRCIKADNVAFAVEEFINNGYRTQIKYKEDISDDYAEGFKEAVSYLTELLTDYNV